MKTLKTTNLKTSAITMLLLAASLTMLNVNPARSQTFKADFSTKLVLAAGGIDPANSLTINAASGMSTPLTLTFPSGDTAASYVLASDGSGHLVWSSSAGSITLVGDVTGPAGSNAISDLAGNDIVAAINNAATTSDINAPVGITGTSLTASGGGTITTTGAIDGGTGVFTGALSADSLASTGGFSTSGGVANINTSGNSPVNIGTSNDGSAGAITIGDSSSGSVSATNIEGQVNFGGPVSFPAGSVTASSLALADNEVLIGGSDGYAHPQTLGTDIATTHDGTVTVSAASGASGFTVTNSTTLNKGVSVSGDATNLNVGTDANDINIGNGTGANAIGIGNDNSTNTIAGATTIGSTSLSSGTGSIAAGVLTLDATHSLFMIGTAGPVSSISTTTTTGRIVQIINADGSNPIALTSGGGLALNGADVIMGSGGSLTLIYDGSTWRMLAAQ